MTPEPFRTELWLRAMPMPQRVVAIATVALLTLLLTFWTVAMVGLVRDAWDPPVNDPFYRQEWDYFRNKYEWEQQHQQVRPPKDVRDAGALAVAQEMREWAGEEPIQVPGAAIAARGTNTINQQQKE